MKNGPLKSVSLAQWACRADAMLAKGVEATFQGHRTKDKNKRVMKAERVIIKGKLYNLYPDRD
jgi:hypothetical protein